MNCTLVTPFFSVPNLQLFVGVNATVPSWVEPGEQANIEDSFALIRIPPTTAGALSVVSADTVAGIANIFNLSLTNADPAVINVTEDPVSYGPQLVPPGQETTLRVPNSGVLPDVGPITATGAAGTSIEARLIRLETQLRATNSTNPQIDQTLPFFCDAQAGADNLVSTIPIQEPVIEVPSITSIAPTTVLETGGESVTITGENLEDAVVSINGDEVAATVNAEGTSITFTAPALAPGTADVVVTTPGGSDSTTLTVEDVPDPVGEPVITGISPASVSESGGETVTISGTDLADATVTVDGDEVAATVNAEGTSITFTAPAHAPGTVDVVVTTEGGSDTASLTYTEDVIPVEEPVITGISPGSVSESGGETVTITGTDLGGATVTVDGDEVAATVNAEGTSITFTAPAHAPGTVDVVVTTEGGSDTASLTYTEDVIPVEEPVITGISPGSVSESGGETVTITGTDLGGATVTVDGDEVAATVNAAGTSITFTAPAHAPGTVDVVVTTEGGSDTASLTYSEDPDPVLPPDVSGIAPNNGPLAGGNSVTISGANLGTVTGVTFGANAAAITGQTATSVTVTVPPAAAAGAVTVTVTNPDGSDTTSYTYNQPDVPGDKAPTVSKLLPNTALAKIGGITLVTGTNLDTTKSVKVGGKTAPFVKLSKTQLLVLLPALNKGTYDLTVTNATGTSPTSAASKVRYISLW